MRIFTIGRKGTDIVLEDVLTICLLLLLVAPVHVGAQLNAEFQNSAMRIICPGPPKDGAKGFKVFQIKLSSGETLNCGSSSFGTGFVINDEGIMVTNNHVVATDSLEDTPSPIVMVMQKVGAQFFLHKAKVLWQSPNADVAIIEAPTVKAPALSILFDDSKSTPSEEVYSMGYPGATDMMEEEWGRTKEVSKIFWEDEVNWRIEKREKEVGRKLNQSEMDTIAADDDSISRQHAHIRKDGDRFLVADRNSSNHTAVNDCRNAGVFDEVPIREGDTLTLGEVRLDFRRL